MVLNSDTVNMNIQKWTRKFMFLPQNDYKGIMTKEYQPGDVPELWIYGGSLDALSPITLVVGEIKNALAQKYTIAEVQNLEQKGQSPQNGVKVFQLVTTEGQWMVFEEIARSMKQAFESKGHICYVNTNGWLQGSNVVSILYGSHCYPAHWIGLVDKSCIVYNLEQLSDTSHTINRITLVL